MKSVVVEKVLAAIIISVVVVGALAAIGLLLAFPIKWTWNATMPYLFTWPAITWGKAWCLLFLCGCLIRSSSSK